MVSTRCVLLGQKGAPEKGFYAKHREKSCRDAQPRNLLRLLLRSCSGKVVAPASRVKDGHPLKRMALPFEVPKVRRGDDVVVAGAGEGLPYQHKTVRFREWQRP